MMTSSILRRTFMGLGLLCLAGCRDISRFDTEGKSAYCGKLLAPDFATAGLAADSDAASALAVGLTLDMSQIATRPGFVFSNDADSGLCTPHALFEEAPLRTVTEALSDKISTMQMGENHEQDLVTWLDSTCLGSMVAFVSLLRDGNVELRLLKPASEPTPEASAAERPGFGVFSLKRHDDGCGF